MYPPVLRRRRVRPHRYRERQKQVELKLVEEESLHQPVVGEPSREPSVKPVHYYSSRPRLQQEKVVYLVEPLPPPLGLWPEQEVRDYRDCLPEELLLPFQPEKDTQRPKRVYVLVPLLPPDWQPPVVSVLDYDLPDLWRQLEQRVRREVLEEEREAPLQVGKVEAELESPLEERPL